MIKIIANRKEVMVNMTIDEVINEKSLHQGESGFKLEAEFDGVFRKMRVDSALTAEEIAYIRQAPESKFSGRQIWNSDLWVYYDQKEKKIYRGSGCGVDISSPHESLRGF